MNDFEAGIGESLPQEFHQPLVFFDRENTRAGFENKFSESAESRPDFNDVIGRGQFGFVDDPARQITIVKKILAERLDGGDPNFPQGCVDLGELRSGESGGLDGAGERPLFVHKKM